MSVNAPTTSQEEPKLPALTSTPELKAEQTPGAPEAVAQGATRNRIADWAKYALAGVLAVEAFGVNPNNATQANDAQDVLGVQEAAAESSKDCNVNIVTIEEGSEEVTIPKIKGGNTVIARNGATVKINLFCPKGAGEISADGSSDIDREDHASGGKMKDHYIVTFNDGKNNKYVVEVGNKSYTFNVVRIPKNANQEYVDNLAAELNGKIDAVDKKADKAKDRAEEANNRVDKVEGRVTTLEKDERGSSNNKDKAAGVNLTLGLNKLSGLDKPGYSGSINIGKAWNYKPNAGFWGLQAGVHHGVKEVDLANVPGPVVEKKVQETNTWGYIGAQGGYHAKGVLLRGKGGFGFRNASHPQFSISQGANGDVRTVSKGYYTVPSANLEGTVEIPVTQSTPTVAITGTLGVHADLAKHDTTAGARDVISGSNAGRQDQKFQQSVYGGAAVTILF